jgi:hypothetical protein
MRLPLMGLGMLIAIGLLAACGPVIDPCTADPNLPTCRTASSAANATIAAITAQQDGTVRQAQMKATQDAIALKTQQEQGEINSRATQQAVSIQATAGAGRVYSEATRQAVELQALKNSIIVSATQQAIGLNALTNGVYAEATKTALKGKIEIDQATAQASAAGIREWFFIGLVIVGLGSGVTLAVWYSRSIMHAAAHGVKVKASFRTYGPNNNRAVMLLPGKNGSINALNIDDMIGEFANSNGLQSTLSLLDVPDREKFLAYIEQAKRRKAVEIAHAAGGWPELDAPEQGGSQSAAGQTIGPRYQIVAPTETPARLPAPEVVEVLDAEWKKVYA